MPVVVLTAPSTSAADAHTVLKGIAAAVAGALGLQPDDVHAMSVHAHAAATGSTEAAPWPVVMMHGRAREAAAMRAAVEAVTDVLVALYEVPAGQIWVQWAQ